MVQIRRRRLVVRGGICTDLLVDGDEPTGSYGSEARQRLIVEPGQASSCPASKPHAE